MEARMNRLLLAAGVFAAALLAGTPAKAQNYPWCAQYAGTGSQNCGYTTYAQCMASLFGNGGVCDQNTQYSPPPGPHRTR
jgi:Protein of unknown function (DUF3551)